MKVEECLIGFFFLSLPPFLCSLHQQILVEQRHARQGASCWEYGTTKTDTGCLLGTHAPHKPSVYHIRMAWAREGRLQKAARGVGFPDPSLKSGKKFTEGTVASSRNGDEDRGPSWRGGQGAHLADRVKDRLTRPLLATSSRKALSRGWGDHILSGVVEGGSEGEKRWMAEATRRPLPGQSERGWRLVAGPGRAKAGEAVELGPA